MHTQNGGAHSGVDIHYRPATNKKSCVIRIAVAVVNKNKKGEGAGGGDCCGKIRCANISLSIE